MATQTLNTSLTLTSTGNVSGIFTLSNTETDRLNFDDTSVASATVTAVHAGLEIYPVGVTDVRYVYMRNLDTAEWIEVSEAGGTIKYAKLGPGDWMFLPVNASMGIKIWSDTGKTANLEYAYFKKI
tara:strand:+ start:890 stop:1267 length:378 start_codon:yes stop_codon:yes gene_type:complete